MDPREQFLPTPSSGYVTPDAATLVIVANGYFYLISLQDPTKSRQIRPINQFQKFLPCANSDYFLYATYSLGFKAVFQRLSANYDSVVINDQKPSGTADFTVSPSCDRIYYLTNGTSGELCEAPIDRRNAITVLEPSATGFHLSKDGSELFYSVWLNGWGELRRRELATGTVTNLTRLAYSQLSSCVAFSPDDSRIVVVSPQTADEFSADDLQTPLRSVPIVGALAPRYAKSGRLVFLSQNQHFGCWDLTGKFPPRFDPQWHATISDPVASPDERWVVTMKPSLTGIVAYDLRSEELAATEVSTDGNSNTAELRGQWWNDESNIFYWVSRNGLLTCSPETDPF